MNVNFCGLGTNLGRLRIFLAGAALLAAGCLVLGSGSRSRQSAQHELNPSSAGLATATSPLLASLADSTPQQPAQSLKNRALASYHNLPIMFEPNVGQVGLTERLEGRGSKIGDDVKFLAHGTGYSLFLTNDGAVMSLRGRDSGGGRSEALRMRLVGANPAAKMEGANQLPGKTNYFIGNNATEWRREIPQFARVRYEEIYPGINLVFYGRQGQLEYDFQVAPGSNPAQAELEFDGSKKLELSEGSLIVKGQGGSVRLETPRAYQQVAGHEQPVESHFVLHAGNRVGFELGAYDHSRELVIDPILTYSTYFGGTADETCPSFVTNVPATPATATPGCPAIAIDNVSDIYLIGATDSISTSFPGTGVLIPPSTNSNIYIAKLDPTGSVLLYLDFLGGGGTDVTAGAAVDGGGNVYLAGTTTSGINGTAAFPTVQSNAYQTVPEANSAGTSHVFVTLLDSGGAQLNYSSYLSGNGTDIASGMTVDARGDIFVTGTTTSSDTGTTQDQFPASALPQAQPFQISPRGPIQFFVTKVNTAAFQTGSIIYSTYFGGNTAASNPPIAIGGGIAVDSSGNIYFSGTTNYSYTGESPTTDFPILNAYQPCLNTAAPTVNTNPQTCTTSATAATDAFVAKLNPLAAGGSGQLLWSSYFGGTNDDSSTAITLDSGAANVYITGVTDSPTIVPVGTAIAFQSFQVCLNQFPNPVSSSQCTGNTTATDGYVARLSNPTAAFQTLGYFSYLGGSGDDGSLAIAVDSASGALITGFTQSTDFPVLPTPSPIQSVLKGPQDAFLARLNTQAVTGQVTGSYSTYFGGSGTDTGTSIVLDPNLNTYVAGTTNSPDFPVAAPFQGALKGGFDAFASKLGTSADLQITGLLSLGTGQLYISAGNQATFTYTITNNGPDLASNITVTDNISPSVTNVPLTFVSATASAGSCTQPSANTVPIVCTIGSLQAGGTATVTIGLAPTAAGNFSGGPVTVGFADSNTSDPNPSNNKVTISGRASDFSVTVTPANQSVPAAGDTASYTVLLSPDPVYGANVSLSCSGTPTGSACQFQPGNSIPLGASPFAASLNVTTTARPVTTVLNKSWPGRFYAFWLSVPGIALIGLGAPKGRRARAVLAIFMCSLVFGLIALQPACSGANTPPTVAGTPPGTHTITLTATSGTGTATFTRNQTFNLSVP